MVIVLGPPGPDAISVVRKTVKDVGVVEISGVVAVTLVEVAVPFVKGATVVELLRMALNPACA